MQFKFLGQPFPGTQIGAFVTEALRKPGRTHAWFITAWAKASGLGRMIEPLTQFKRQGGQSEIIVGVDEGGATREGLELALDLFSAAYVFHDPGTRTFHPKIFVIEGEDNASLVVGSSNLTRGGLFTNYEAGLAVELDLTKADEASLLGEIRAYRDSIMALSNNCLRLDLSLLERLIADERMRISSESRDRPDRNSSQTQEPSIFVGAVQGLLGAPTSSLPRVAERVHATNGSPGLSSPTQSATTNAVSTPVQPQQPIVAPTASAPQSTLQASQTAQTGFWKRLSKNDVSVTSSPGQMIIPIEFRAFFEPLTLDFDRTQSGGARQYDRSLTLTFVDGTYQKQITDARIILYEPAADHPRQNKELRFTFRDRDVLQRLSQDDVLVFKKSRDTFVVERRLPGSMGTKRFAAL